MFILLTNAKKIVAVKKENLFTDMKLNGFYLLHFSLYDYWKVYNCNPRNII